MPEPLPILEPTDEAFAPYGTVVRRPARDHDAEGPGWHWWAETVTFDGDGRPWTIGYLDIEPAPPARFDWAERHMRTQEAVIPVSGASLLYVAPPDHPEEPDRLPPFESFAVFRLAPGTGVVLEPAVWHGAPLADGGPAKAIVLLQQGTGRDDVTKVAFEDTPLMIEEG